MYKHDNSDYDKKHVFLKDLFKNILNNTNRLNKI